MENMQDTEEKEKNEALSEIVDEANKRVYEVGYLLVPTISEADISAVYGNLKESVLSLGGLTISDEMPKMIPLAYVMTKIIANVRNKFNTAYFGWMKFTMDTDKISILEDKLDLDPIIIRFLVLKTVKENTIASRRFVRGESMRRKPKSEKNEDDEVVTPINKEEIDKEIDALVV